MIPENWKSSRFGQLYAEPSRNGIYKSSQYQGRGTRIVNMGEMFGLEFISDQDMNRVALTTKEISVSGLQDGDLLFGRRSVVPAGAGKCSLVVSPTDPITFESSIIRVRLNRKDAHPKFYYYFFASPAGRSLVGSIVSGTTIKGIRATELRDLMVPLVPNAEQEAIADALSDADALIESLEQLLVKKRNVKRGAMQQLLTGKKRLPGFSDPWRETTVGENTILFAGGTPSTRVPAYWGGPVPWMSSGELHQKRIYQVRGRITEMGLANSAAKWVPTGSVLVGLAGQGRTRGTVAFSQTKLTTNQSVAAIVPQNSVDGEFLFHVLDARYDELRELSSGDGGRGGLNLKLLSALGFQVPLRKAEQTAIAASLSDMDAEIEALETKIAKARHIEHGMMQELLTGRIRLV